MRIDKIATGVVYRMDELSQNLLMFGILIVDIEKILKICQFFKT